MNHGKTLNFVLIGGLMLSFLFLNQAEFTNVSGELSASEHPQASREPQASQVITDKVYTFSKASNSKLFQQHFQEGYIYYIYIELVTMTEIDMSISITDPDGSFFPIFDSEMFPDKAGESFEIPFGCAVTGTHDITFTVSFSAQAADQECANLYISLEKAYKWPISGGGDHEADIDTFQDKTTIIYKYYLDGDTMYQGKISRISAISEEYSPEVSVTLNLRYAGEDGTCKGCTYTIFREKEPLPKVEEELHYHLGTNCEGWYELCLTVYCVVPNVNIGHGLEKDYRISSQVEANQTAEQLNNSNSVNMNTSSFANVTMIPTLPYFGTMITVGGFSLALIAIVRKHKKKDVVLPKQKEKYK